MKNQIEQMQEMVRRTEIMLTEMENLLEQAKQEEVSLKTLTDEAMERLADAIADNIKYYQYPNELVEINTHVSGMNIEIELEWDDSAKDTLSDFILKVIKNHEN